MSCHVSPPHPRVPPGLGCLIPDARRPPHSMATPGKMRGVCSVSTRISEIFISQNLTTSLTCSSSSVFAGAGVSTGAAEGLVGGKAEQSPGGWRQQQGRGDGGGWGCGVWAHVSLQPPSHSQRCPCLMQLPALSLPCQLPAASWQRCPVGCSASFPSSQLAGKWGSCGPRALGQEPVCF